MDVAVTLHSAKYNQAPVGAELTRHLKPPVVSHVKPVSLPAVWAAGFL